MVDKLIISLLSVSILLLDSTYSLFILSISSTIKLTSILSNSFFVSKYNVASSLCFFSGSTCISSSFIISFILSILSCVLSNFFSASIFLFLYFKTPAALSNITLLSSGLALNTSAISPCEIILNDSLALPLSKSKSNISFSLTFSLFK